MPRIESLPAELSARDMLDRVVDTYGAWATLRALAAVVFTRRRRPHLPTGLRDHLRRDLGLPPETSSPRYWDIR
jgi:hypothetical protein